jgi:hypothetical protein
MKKKLVKATGLATTKLMESLQAYSKIMSINPGKLTSFEEF